jgi:hypothetical protein
VLGYKSGGAVPRSADADPTIAQKAEQGQKENRTAPVREMDQKGNSLVSKWGIFTKSEK